MVKDSLPPRFEGPRQVLRPGDWVLTHNFQRKSSLEPRWKGPVQVLLATQTTVKCTGHKHWIHASHVKKAPLPLPYDQWVKECIPDFECEQIPQQVHFSDGELVKEGEVAHRLINLTPVEAELMPIPLFEYPDCDLPRYNLRPRAVKNFD